MRILNVMLLENAVENLLTTGIKLRHKENPSDYSNLAVDVLTREYYISNTKKLQDHIDSMGGTDKVSFEDIQIVPLYRKCLVDLKQDKKGYETILIRIETSVSEIASIDVEGVYALQPIITNNKSEKDDRVVIAAFAATIQKGKEDKFKIKIHRMDNKLFILNGNGVNECTEVGYKVKKANRLTCRKLISIPKKSYITNDGNDKKEGYITVLVSDVMSKNTVIKEYDNDNGIDYVLSDKLTEDQIKAAKNLLKWVKQRIY